MALPEKVVRTPIPDKQKKQPPDGFLFDAHICEGKNGHYLETDWYSFMKGTSGKKNPQWLYNHSHSDSPIDIEKHLQDEPMADFSDLYSFVDSLDARLAASLQERLKRKKEETWDGCDLEVENIIDRRGIPFSERRKQAKRKPVLVIAQRLANVATMGGNHKWNAAQGMYLCEYFINRGYDVEFYAYSDHRCMYYDPGTKVDSRVLTSVKVKGVDDHFYPDIVRRALCDGSVYRASWWGFRGLTGITYDGALGAYWYANNDGIDGFTWAEGRKVINLPLTLDEDECVSNIQRVLEGDPDMILDLSDGQE